MKAYLLFTATGSLVILTSCDSIKNPEVLKELGSKGIHKFVAHEVPIELAESLYVQQFEDGCRNLHKNNRLYVLDNSGEHIFRNIEFDDLGPEIYYEPELADLRIRGSCY
jgi:hypothetical protein